MRFGGYKNMTTARVRVHIDLGTFRFNYDFWYVGRLIQDCEYLGALNHLSFEGRYEPRDLL